MDSDIASDSDSPPDIADKCEEGDLSDLDQDISLTDTGQVLSEEQNYRETMRGIRSYMGWSHVPDVYSALANSEDNPFAAPKQQPAGKISVQLPTDDWLCRKMDRLNLTLTQGYPSKGSDAGGLQRDQWEKSACEATYMCNQAAGFSRCLSKVQQDLSSQLKIIQAEHSKGKSADKVGSAKEELQYLLLFNSSISQCMAKTIEHMSDFAFVSMYNFTLIRRDSYLAHVKAGIKQDTLAALCQAPMDLDTLFPDTVLRKAEKDISKFEDRGRTHTSSNHKDTRFQPYKRSDKPYQDNKPARPALKNIGRLQKKKTRFQTNKFSSRQARGQASFK